MHFWHVNFHAAASLKRLLESGYIQTGTDMNEWGLTIYAEVLTVDAQVLARARQEIMINRGARQRQDGKYQIEYDDILFLIAVLIHEGEHLRKDASEEDAYAAERKSLRDLLAAIEGGGCQCPPQGTNDELDSFGEDIQRALEESYRNQERQEKQRATDDPRGPEAKEPIIFFPPGWRGHGGLD